MQMKKEEVRMAILNSGKGEFLSHGFEKASLRNIVKKAGTTTGNFYNYFANKEALFEALVIDDYNKFIYFIDNHDRIDRPDYLWNISNPTLWKDVLGDLIDDMVPHLDIGFVLLLDCSEGTKYYDARKMLVGMLDEHFIEHVDKLGNITVSKEFGFVLANQILDGLILILRKEYTKEKKHVLIRELIIFYIIGTMGILGEY